MKVLFMAVALWGFVLPISAYSLPLNSDSYDDFLAKTKADPTRTYVLKLSTSWCGPCKDEALQLKNMPTNPSTAVARAYWSSVDTDIDDDAYNAFMAKVGLPMTDQYPTNIAFKAGRPVGMIAGWDKKDAEQFLNDVEAVTPAQSLSGGLSVIPSFPCGPNKKEQNVCLWGLSGYQGERKSDTDDFGRANLASFANIFASKPFEKLLAPSVPSMGMSATKSGKGFLFVRNPFADTEYGDVSSAVVDLDQLADSPGKSARILITGHGTPEGVEIKYRKKDASELKNKNDYPYVKTYLDMETFAQKVAKGRRMGKQYRALFLQCHGGDFVGALMPEQGQAISCGISASIPEKQAEGCYEMTYGGTRKDYLGAAMRLKKCDGTQDGRDLHYQIVGTSAGHDIPMLSSEYFLLYGPASKLLGEGPTAPPPPFGITRKQMQDGVNVYVDRVNRSVIKITYHGQEISFVQPRSSKIESLGFYGGDDVKIRSCSPEYAAHSHWQSVAIAHTPVYTNLLSHYVMTRPYGKESDKNRENHEDCDVRMKVVAASLPAGMDERWIKEGMWVSTTDDGVDPNGNNLDELSEKEKRISITGLKREARVMLATVLPLLRGQPGKNGADSTVKVIANAIKQVDPSRAQAIDTLLKRLHASRKPGAFFALDELIGAALNNLSDRTLGSDQATILSRLAHLVAVSAAEIKLREAAQKDPNGSAAKFVKQLNSLKNCEQDLL